LRNPSSCALQEEKKDDGAAPASHGVGAADDEMGQGVAGADDDGCAESAEAEEGGQVGAHCGGREDARG